MKYGLEILPKDSLQWQHSQQDSNSTDSQKKDADISNKVNDWGNWDKALQKISIDISLITSKINMFLNENLEKDSESRKDY